MFAITQESAPPFEEIYDALYVRKAPPPNQSTQTQPIAATNFLFELDKVTQVCFFHVQFRIKKWKVLITDYFFVLSYFLQEVVGVIMKSQKTFAGDDISVPGVNEKISLGRNVGTYIWNFLK